MVLFIEFQRSKKHIVIKKFKVQYHQSTRVVNSNLPHQGAYASTITALPSAGLKRSSLEFVSSNFCNELKRVDVGETCCDLSLYDENAST